MVVRMRFLHASLMPRGVFQTHIPFSSVGLQRDDGRYEGMGDEGVGVREGVGDCEGDGVGEVGDIEAEGDTEGDGEDEGMILI